jgi:DNA-binding NtrC family response regulator
LNVVPIEVPPLRDRRQDIEPLVQHFIEKQSERHHRPRLGPEVAEALRAYDWPGNVRELENVVQRAVVLSQEDELTLEDFSLQLRPPPAAAPLPREEARETEAQELREVIVRSGGNLARAARLLGIPRTTLVSRAAKLGLL